MPARALACMLALWLVCAPGCSSGTSVAPEDSSKEANVRVAGATAGDLPALCLSDADCSDDDGCTTDECTEGTCVNEEIRGCVRCRPQFDCPNIDLVFMLDTSGSMRDEAEALCGALDDIVADVTGDPSNVRVEVLGISENGDSSFSCITDNVVNLLGGDVPGQDGCTFPDGHSPFESWGPGSAIVGGLFDWRPDAFIRLLVPIYDEGPCNGDRPDGCNDPGDDANSVFNAAFINADFGVGVFPIAGTGTGDCAIELGADLALLTGGTSFTIDNAATEVPTIIRSLLEQFCTIDPGCDDGSVCTTGDTCELGVCVGTPTYDTLTECCDPETGGTTNLTDNDPCTRDVCDVVTGEVLHPPAPAGVLCNDNDVCTIDDVCDGSGECAGSNLNFVSCESDDDCGTAACNEISGFCRCDDVPLLCLNALDATVSDTSCYLEDEEIVVQAVLGPTTTTIIAASVLMNYDPSVLEFLDLQIGGVLDPRSPFVIELGRDVDTTIGEIFTNVSIVPGGQGTNGDVLVAELRFRAIGACSSDELCFLDGNPKDTALVGDEGNSVAFESCCTGVLNVTTDPVSLDCPVDVSVDADPGTPTTTVTWDAPIASSGCDGEVARTCTAENSFGVDMTDRIEGGGLMPAGASTFRCEATDSCGATAECEWSVLVGTENLLLVDLELSPSLANDPSHQPLQRCIEFALYSNCTIEPVRVQATVDFGLPFNLPGLAGRVEVPVPAGQYVCITARDTLHTLPSVSTMTIEDGKYRARFVGDPLLGGNWLKNGDLDGNGVIDVLDYARFVEAMFDVRLPNTPCGTEGPAADLNGDGRVTAIDWNFIEPNLGTIAEANCCDFGDPGQARDAVTEISVEELLALGLDGLGVADMNGDGMIDITDVAMFTERDFHLKPDLSDRLLRPELVNGPVDGEGPGGE